MVMEKLIFFGRPKNNIVILHIIHHVKAPPCAGFLLCSRGSAVAKAMAGQADFSFVTLAVLHQDVAGILIPNEPALTVFATRLLIATHTNKNVPLTGDIFICSRGRI